MTISERACQVWAVLAWAASHRQTLTYTQLAQATGAFQAGLGDWLGPIQSFCQLNDLPPLTVLVVQKKSGLPGIGFTGASAESLAAEREKVFQFSWLAHGNPGAQKLREAVQKMPSKGPRAADPPVLE